MKLDIDELERKLRGRNGCPDLDPQWPTPAGPRGPILCVLHPDCKCGSEDRRVAVAAASPPIALALIARIRELEVLAKEYADCYEGEGYPNEAAAVRVVLERGTVLP